MATTAFPVRQTSDGVGCTDVTMRKIMAALYPDKGIISGLNVSGASSAAYTVGSGVAVCSKGSGDGNVLAYYEGGTVATTANSSGNPRIDSVWIESHDATQGDSDNLVALGVTQGTPAAAPVAPSIPTDATLLANMMVPGGASGMSQAAVADTGAYSVPYGASLGVLVNRSYVYNGEFITTQQKTLMSGNFNLPTARTIQLKATTTMSSVGDTDWVEDAGMVYVRFYLDGQYVQQFGRPVYRQKFADSAYCEWNMTVPAGNHTARLDIFSRTNDRIKMWYVAGENGYPGQRFQVVDLGPARDA